MSYYLDALKKYAVFRGRARRKEYWMFALFNAIFAIVAMILDNVLGLAIKHMYVGLIYFLYALAIVLPKLAITVRRLHDTDRSGGWIFISFIPLVGAIWILVLLCLAGTPGDNRYGKNPKQIDIQNDTN